MRTPHAGLAHFCSLCSKENWTDIAKRNLEKDITWDWEEANELAAGRTEWRQRVIQCVMH